MKLTAATFASKFQTLVRYISTFTSVSENFFKIKKGRNRNCYILLRGTSIPEYKDATRLRPLLDVILAYSCILKSASFLSRTQRKNYVVFFIKVVLHKKSFVR